MIIKTADDLLALLAERGGAVVRGSECGECELRYALAAGRGYINRAGDSFVVRPPRVMVQGSRFKVHSFNDQ